LQLASFVLYATHVSSMKSVNLSVAVLYRFTADTLRYVTLRYVTLRRDLDL